MNPDSGITPALMDDLKAFHGLHPYTRENNHRYLCPEFLQYIYSRYKAVYIERAQQVIQEAADSPNGYPK